MGVIARNNTQSIDNFCKQTLPRKPVKSPQVCKSMRNTQGCYLTLSLAFTYSPCIFLHNRFPMHTPLSPNDNSINILVPAGVSHSTDVKPLYSNPNHHCSSLHLTKKSSVSSQQPADTLNFFCNGAPGWRRGQIRPLLCPAHSSHTQIWVRIVARFNLFDGFLMLDACITFPTKSRFPHPRSTFNRGIDFLILVFKCDFNAV